MRVMLRKEGLKYDRHGTTSRPVKVRTHAARKWTFIPCAGNRKISSYVLHFVSLCCTSYASCIKRCTSFTLSTSCARCTSGVLGAPQVCSVYLRCVLGVPQVCAWCTSGVLGVPQVCSVYLRCARCTSGVLGVPQVCARCTSGVCLVYLRCARCASGVLGVPQVCARCTSGVLSLVPWLYAQCRLPGSVTRFCFSPWYPVSAAWLSGPVIRLSG